MLNRLFIIVALLVILALAAAFVGPYFVNWSDYRGRMEAMARQVLGTDVTIAGPIEFSLLPNPRLKFADMVVGPEAEPLIRVASVEAEFNLIDFLRDRYVVNKLVLNQPAVDLRLDESGLLELPRGLEGLQPGNVAISNAQIVGGVFRLTDRRGGQAGEMTEVDGELRLQSGKGPFAFQGRGTVGGHAVVLRISTSGFDADGNARLSAFAQAKDIATSFTAEGEIAAGLAPRFAGDLTVRYTPPPPAEAEATARGDVIATAALNANTDRITISALTIQPDENRAGNRLTGMGYVQIGQSPAFELTMSGGAIALPPRDATAEDGPQPYELVRLLRDLPAPPIVPLPGKAVLDIADFDLRAVGLHNLHVEATSDGSGWAIERANATIGKDGVLALSGRLGAEGGKPVFSGEASLASERLDLLSLLWRKVAQNSPLFAMPGSVAGEVTLAPDAVAVSDGTLTLNGTAHGFGLTLGLGEGEGLDVSAELGSLDALDSAALLALLPDIGQDARFGLSFPLGHFKLAAERAQLFGLEGEQLSAEGTWDGAALTFDRLVAGAFGGVALDLSGAVSGTPAAPLLVGQGSVGLTGPRAPALDALYQSVKAPAYLRDFLAHSFPAQLRVNLEKPDAQGGQLVTATGKAGGADVGFSAQLSAGLAQALSAPLTLTVQAASGDAAGFTRQLGFGDSPLFPQAGPVRLKALIEGSLSGDLAANIIAEGGGDHLGFEGKVSVAGNGALKGGGNLDLVLTDASALADIVGAAGIYAPPLTGKALLAFEGGDKVSLTDIKGMVGASGFDGNLAFNRAGGISAVSGVLGIDSLDIAGLAAVLTGPSGALDLGGSFWPDGPIAIGDASRQTSGTINILAGKLVQGDTLLVNNPGFDLVWDANSVRLRDLQGTIGGGTITLDIGVCCAGLVAAKTISGRVALADVDLSALVPPTVAAAIGGKVAGSAQFEGSGDSVTDALGLMAGDGSFTLSNLSIADFDPKAFAAVAGLPDILTLDEASLSQAIAGALDAGPFTAAAMEGGFSIAAGTVRLANLAADGDGARLFGGVALKLADLGLDGAFSLTPIGTVDANGLISETTSTVSARITGTLLAPEKQLVLQDMVDAIKVRAYELEVDRLEQLQAEDIARQKAAAEERARLMAENNRKKALEEAIAGQAAEVARMLEKHRQDELAKAERQLQDILNATPPLTVIDGQQISIPPLVFDLPQQPEGGMDFSD